MLIIFELANLKVIHHQDMPFTIEPHSGVIPVGGEQPFTVRFSPLECADFNAILSARYCAIENTC